MASAIRPTLRISEEQPYKEAIGLRAVDVLPHSSDDINQSKNNIVYVKSSGNFLSKKIRRSISKVADISEEIEEETYKTPHEQSRPIICSIYNYPIRGQVWKFNLCAIRKGNKSQSVEFALADERGQIMAFSCGKNSYYTIQSATSIESSVTSICYIESRKQDIALAYENGKQVIVDYETRDIVMSINTTALRKQIPVSPIRASRSHPYKPLIVNIHDNGRISLWDIGNGKNVGNIIVKERIVDVQFEVLGEFIAVILEEKGAIWYQTSTLQLAFRCSLPSSCISINTQSQHNPFHNQGYSHGRWVILLSGNNGSIYTWIVRIPMPSKLSSSLVTAGEILHGKNYKGNGAWIEGIDCSLISVIHLPLQIGGIIAMSSIHETNIDMNETSSDSISQARILLYTMDGDALILNIEGLEALYSIGRYTIIGQVSSSELHGYSSEDMVRHHLIGDDQGPYSSFRRSSMCSNRLNHSIVIGVDGAARFIDLSACIGHHPSPSHSRHSIVGSILRNRSPRGDNLQSSDRIDREDVPHRGRPIARDDNNIQHRKANQTRLKKAMKDSNISLPSAIDSTPLYQLANAISPEDKQITHKKLRSFYEIHGSFPSRYRPLIWRFLLQLPENAEAYSQLVQCGVHKSYESLYETYPLKSRKVFTRLQSLCSVMTHWDNIFGEVSQLPQVIFPFSLIYEKDELATFETVMTIYMYWGFTWCNTFPHPPLHILSILEQLLQLHDKVIYNHMVNTLHIQSVGTVLWQLLSTLFTEIMHKDDWLRCMDYLILHFENMVYLLLMPIGIIKALRVTILSMDIDEKIYTMVGSLQGMNIATVIKSVHKMAEHTPSKLWIHLTTKQNAKDGRIFQSNDEDTETVIRNLSKSSGKPIFPLPVGRYPVYNGYPKSIVDWQIKEREKILAMNHEMKRKDSILSSIQGEIESIEASHESFMKTYEAANRNQLAHQKNVIAAEKMYMRQLEDIEESIAQHRLKALQVVENSAKEEALLLQKLAMDAKDLLQAKQKHIEDKSAVLQNIEKLRQFNESAEAKKQDKLRQMELHRTREETLRTITETLTAKENEYAAEDEVMMSRWREEDERKKQSHYRDIAESNVLLEQETQSILHDELQAQMELLERQRQKKLSDIQSIRDMKTQETLQTLQHDTKPSDEHSRAYIDDMSSKKGMQGRAVYDQSVDSPFNSHQRMPHSESIDASESLQSRSKPHGMVLEGDHGRQNASEAFDSRGREHGLRDVDTSTQTDIDAARDIATMTTPRGSGNNVHVDKDEEDSLYDNQRDKSPYKGLNDSYSFDDSDSSESEDDLDYEKYLPLDDAIKTASKVILKDHSSRELNSLRQTQQLQSGLPYSKPQKSSYIKDILLTSINRDIHDMGDGMDMDMDKKRDSYPSLSALKEMANESLWAIRKRR